MSTHFRALPRVAPSNQTTKQPSSQPTDLPTLPVAPLFGPGTRGRRRRADRAEGWNSGADDGGDELRALALPALPRDADGRVDEVAGEPVFDCLLLACIGRITDGWSQQREQERRAQQAEATRRARLLVEQQRRREQELLNAAQYNSLRQQVSIQS